MYAWRKTHLVRLRGWTFENLSRSPGVRRMIQVDTMKKTVDPELLVDKEIRIRETKKKKPDYDMMAVKAQVSK